MSDGETPGNDRVEFIINKVLRWGVMGSLILITAGTIYIFCYSGNYGVQGGTPADLQRLIQPDIPFTFTFEWFFRGLRHASGTCIIVLGLLVLIATPILRVAIAVVTFALEKDRAAVVMSLVVFFLLIVCFFIGKS